MCNQLYATKPAKSLTMEGKSLWNEYSSNKRKKGGCVGDQPVQDKNACCLNGQEPAASVSAE